MFCIKDVRINLFSDTNDNKNSSLSEYSLSVFVYSGLRNILHQQPRDLSSAVVRRPVSSSQSDGGGGGDLPFCMPRMIAPGVNCLIEIYVFNSKASSFWTFKPNFRVLNWNQQKLTYVKIPSSLNKCASNRLNLVSLKWSKSSFTPPSTRHKLTGIHGIGLVIRLLMLFLNTYSQSSVCSLEFYNKFTSSHLHIIRLDK